MKRHGLKKADAKRLEENRFYPVALELAWQMRMTPRNEPGGWVGPVAESIANSYIMLLRGITLDLGLEFTAVMSYVMEKDFARWMASPEGIAHNEMLKAKGAI